MFEKIKVFGAIFLIIVSLFGFVLIMATAVLRATKPQAFSDEYNNGICQICGGNYHFSGGNNYVYFYTCDNCDHTIETLNIMK